MINGVEILSSSQVATEFEMHWGLFALIALVVSIGIAICVFCIIFDADFSIASVTISILIGLLVGGFIGFIINCEQEPVSYETHYKVTISDEVSMNEFLDKYEILDQEGKIYTVRERE